MDDNQIYFRLYFARDGRLHAVEMQWFDEHDYDQSRFASDLQFASEEAAWQWLAAERARCQDFLKATENVNE